MPSKTLTAKVKVDTSTAVRSLDNLMKKINLINSSVNKKTNAKGLEKSIEKAVLQQEKLKRSTLQTKLAEERLTTQKNKTAIQAQKVNEAVIRTKLAEQRLLETTNRTDSKLNNIAGSKNRIVTLTKNWNSSLTHTNSIFGSLNSKLKMLASTYLGIMGTKVAINTSDTITSAKNRLNAFNGGDSAATVEAMDKMYAAAQRSRSGYGDMLSNVSKLMALSGDAFQGNIDNAIRFQEIMAKSYVIGGASQAEQHSSMYQMIQALGSGVLQGDELRSVREGAPLAYKQIEKFTQKVLKSEESLKELASQGKVTSDMVVAAIMDSEKQINDTFENTAYTFGQVWTQIKNTATQAFRPALEQLSELLNSDAGKKMISGIGKALVVLGKAFAWVIGKLEDFFNWCSDNWDTIKTVIVDSVAVITTALIGMAIKTAVSFAIAHWVILLVIGVIAALIGILHDCGFTSSEIIGGICGAVMFLYYLLKDVVVWIVNIIYWAIALIWDAVVSIAVVITNLVIAILGIIILVIEGIAQLVLWLITTICAVITTLWNVIYTVAKVIWAVIEALINLIYGSVVALVVAVLKLLQYVAKGIDYVFGSNLSKTIGGWVKTLENSVTDLMGALNPLDGFKDISSQWTVTYEGIGDMYAGNGEYDNWNIWDDMQKHASKIWNLTGDIGELGVDLYLDPTDMNDWAMEHGTNNPMDGWDKGFAFGESLTDKIKGFTTDGLLDPYDPSLALDPYTPPTDLYSNIDDVADDVSEIKDSMDLTNDDLEFLRQIAEMEWRNEFTTAEIKVDMTNNNTINSELDVDGIIDQFATKLQEEANALI